MKIIFSLVFIAFTLGVTAQRSNVAHISTLQLWELMPEKKKADSTLMLMNRTFSEHYNKMNQEVEVLVINYKSDTVSSAAIKADKAVEIQNMQARLENFKKEAEAELARKREELLAPVRKKMQDAINAVAKKNKYDYVIDSSFGNILYTKNPADDIMDLVKKELGL